MVMFSFCGPILLGGIGIDDLIDNATINVENVHGLLEKFK